MRRPSKSAIGLLTVAAVLLVLPTVVALNLHRGVEFSDTGYYHVSIGHMDQIDQQTTQFATAWNVLPIPDDMRWHRGVLWLLMHGAAAWTGLVLWRFARPDRPGGVPAAVLACAVAAGAASTFYVWWLPDPSYNSIGFALNLLVVGLGVHGGLRLKSSSMPIGAAMASGYLLMALLLIRPPTAVGLAAVTLVLLTAVGRPSLTDVWRLLGWSTVGVAAFAASTWLLSEPLTTTWARLEGGLARREVLDRSGGLGASIRLFSQSLLAAIAGPGGVAATAVAIGLPMSGSDGPAWRRAGRVLAVLGLGGLLATFVSTGGLSDPGVSALADLTGLLTAAIAVSAAGLVFVRSRRTQADVLAGTDPTRGVVALVAVAVLGAATAQVVGTTNSWWTHAVFFHGLTLLTLAFLVEAVGRNQHLLRGAVVVTVLCVQAATWTHMVNHPYRLPAGLDEQTIPTPIRDGRTVLHTDPSTHALLNELATGVRGLGGEQRPVLLDRTGRLPLVTYHLDFTAPGSPWLLSGAPGSQALFDRAVADLAEDELRSAWVLDAPDWSQRYDDDAFATRGIDLRDYDVRAIGFSDYLGTEVLLLAPPGG